MVRAGDSGLGPPAAASARRVVARFVDWLVIGIVSAVICWPVAGQVLRGEVTGAAQDSVLSLVTGSFSAADVIGSARHALERVVVVTLLAQVLIVAVYEWTATSAAGVTLGKALLGIRVVPAGTGPAATTGAWGPRMFRRSAAAVLPLGVGAVGFVLAIAGLWWGWIAGFAGLLAAGYDLLPAAVSGSCRHDEWTDSRAAPRYWAPPRPRPQTRPDSRSQRSQRSQTRPSATDDDLWRDPRTTWPDDLGGAPAAWPDDSAWPDEQR